MGSNWGETMTMMNYNTHAFPFTQKYVHSSRFIP